MIDSREELDLPFNGGPGLCKLLWIGPFQHFNSHESPLVDIDCLVDTSKAPRSQLIESHGSHWQSLRSGCMKSGLSQGLQLSSRLIGGEGEMGERLKRDFGPLRDCLDETFNVGDFRVPNHLEHQKILLLTTNSNDVINSVQDHDFARTARLKWEDIFALLSAIHLAGLVGRPVVEKNKFAVFVDLEGAMNSGDHCALDFNITIASNCGKSPRIAGPGGFVANVEPQYTRTQF